MNLFKQQLNHYGSNIKWFNLNERINDRHDYFIREVYLKESRAKLLELKGSSFKQLFKERERVINKHFIK